MFNKKFLNTTVLSNFKKHFSFMSYNGYKQTALNTLAFNRHIANMQGQSHFSIRNFSSSQMISNAKLNNKQKNNWMKWAPIIASALGITVYQIYDLLKEHKQPVDNSKFTQEDLIFTKESEQFKDLTSKIGRISKKGNITTVAIIGVSGSGKTQLVLDYLNEIKEKEFQSIDKSGKGIKIPTTLEDMKEYVEKKIYEGITSKPVKTIFWLNASNVKTLNDSYEELARELKVLDVCDGDCNLIRSAILNELKARPGWFLVFDNVENKHDSGYKTIKDYIPKNSSGKVIVLSNKSLKEIPKEVRMIGLSSDQAVNYLNKIIGNLGDSEEQDNRKRLSVKLARLPYAIRLVANDIKNSKSTCGKYLKAIETFLPLREYNSDNCYEIYKVILNNKVNQLSLDGQELLHICSLFGQDKIPEELLEGKYSGVNSRIKGLLKILKQHDLINVNAPYINMHKVAYDIIGEIFKDKRLLILGKCIALLEYCIDDNNNFKQYRYNKTAYIIHAESVIKHTKDENLTLNSDMILSLTRLKTGVANFYIQNNSMIIEGETLLKQAKKDLEKNLFKEDITQKSAKDICKMLAKRDKSLPTKYAHILYLFSRTYFYLQDMIVPKEIEAALNLAIDIRHEIDMDANKYCKIYDDGSNENKIYTPLYYRSGKALLLIMKSEQEKDNILALRYLNSAENIINNYALPYNKTDVLHQAVCLDTLAKIFLQKAFTETSQRFFHLNKALCYSKEVENLIKDVNDINRKEKFYNTMGDIYFEQGEYKEAKIAFENALPESGKNPDSILAKSYYKLAKISYEIEKDVVNARSYIVKSLEVLEKLKLSNHTVIKKVKDLKLEIFDKINELDAKRLLYTI